VNSTIQYRRYKTQLTEQKPDFINTGGCKAVTKTKQAKFI